MIWIKSFSDLSGCDKFFKLVERLKVGPEYAFWNLHHLWYWVGETHPDGILKNISDLTIAHHAKWHGEPKSFVDALVKEGFIDRGVGALYVHDWDRWRSDPVRLKSNRSGSERRKYDERPTNVGQTSDQEKERESSLSSSPSSPTPPSSTPYSPSKEREKEDSAAKAAALPSQKAKGKKPIANWALLVDHIKRKWEYKKRPNGRFAPTGQDFEHLRKRALVYDAFELMALYDEFIVTADEFYAKNGYAVWVFCKAVDALVDKAGWKAKADAYRANHLKPTTPAEVENAKKLSETMSGMMNGKVSGSIEKDRKTLARVGEPI